MKCRGYCFVKDYVTEPVTLAHFAMHSGDAEQVSFCHHGINHLL